jgi:hypothetical protein
MPGKSRYGKGKHPHHSKKSKAKLRHSTMALQQPTAADTPQPVATITSPPSSRAPTSPAKPRIAQYPYITTELQRIGILAGIILVILIVLALVLS